MARDAQVEHTPVIAGLLQCCKSAAGSKDTFQVVQGAQGLAGEVAELRVVALGLEFGDDDDGKHDLVLGEPGHRPRVGEQDTGVEDVRATGAAG